MAKKFTPHEEEVLSKLAQHMGNPLDDFDHLVIKHVQELQAEKMKAAMRGGDLGPEEFEEQQEQQTGALQQGAATQGQVQAAQAQAAQLKTAPPPTPSGPAGVTIPFSAQRGDLPTAGSSAKEQSPPPPAAPNGQQAPAQEPE